MKACYCYPCKLSVVQESIKVEVSSVFSRTGPSTLRSSTPLIAVVALVLVFDRGRVWSASKGAFVCSCLCLCQCIASPSGASWGAVVLNPAIFYFKLYFPPRSKHWLSCGNELSGIFFFFLLSKQQIQQQKKSSINKMVKVRIAFPRDKTTAASKQETPCLSIKKKKKNDLSFSTGRKIYIYL